MRQDEQGPHLQKLGSVLITGGSGSLGRAISRRLLASNAADRIIVLSRNEHTQDQMERALALCDPQKRMRYRIGDVRDLDRLRMTMRGVDLVIHAAAMKVIHKCENDPFEAINTNVIGAKNVIAAALEVGVKRTVAVSTDKATVPSTLYGASKLCAERLFVNAHIYAGDRDSRFSVVRYGNVAGSRGSVIPLWQKLIADGATKLPVTSPFCTRYWLEMEEAVDLVLWAAEYMSGGEIIVPDMPAYQISTLLEAFGLPGEIVGMRVGEKAAEDMVSEHEYHMFRRVCSYWVAGGNYGGGERLSGPMRSDTATKMSVDDLRDKVAELDPENLLSEIHGYWAKRKEIWPVGGWKAGAA